MFISFFSLFLFRLKDFTTCENRTVYQSSSNQIKEVPLIHNECAKEFSRKDNKVKQGDTLKVKQQIIDNSCQKEIREKTFFCNECKKGFAQIDCFEKHIDTHQKEQSFGCGNCEKFAERLEEKVPCDKRRRERLFSCSDCKKAFAQKR